MPLVGLAFDETFAFARPGAADYRDETGELVEAGAGEPRLDHHEDGRPRGLLVETGDYAGAADRVSVPAGDWESAGPATVLHELELGGEIQRQAVYTLSARACVNAVLASAGRHRRIGAVPGHLRNLGGFVRYRERDWLLPGGLATEEGELLADGAADRLLIEG